MSNEIFEIDNVKQEFLQSIGPEYTNIFSGKQLEMSVYMLNDFCTTLTNNNLVLLRMEPEPVIPPYQQQYQQPPVPQMGIPQQYQQPIQQQDPFIQQQIREMNAQLPPRMPPPSRQVQPQDIPANVKQYPEMRPQYAREQLDNVPPLPPVQEVDLTADKPKSFAEKIREMRAGTKKTNKINPDDNE